MTTIIEKDKMQEQLLGSEVPLNIELIIERERILGVLDETIQKIELALCFPMLLREEFHLLEYYLKAEELGVIMKCSQYTKQIDEQKYSREKLKSDENESHHSSQSISKHSSYESSIIIMDEECSETQTKEDPGVTRAIQILFDNASIQNLISTNLLCQISEGAMLFLKYVHQLRDYVAEQLSISPHQDRLNEQHLNKLWHSNEKAKTDIITLHEKLKQQTADINMKIVAKNLIINRHEVKIDALKKKCVDDIKKNLNESKISMLNSWKNSEFRKNILRAEINDTEDKRKVYRTLTKTREKELRVTRYRAESDLILMIEKYDIEIGEKQAEFDEIMAGFNEEKAQMAKLQEEFDIQEEEYNALKEEKEEEERIIFEDKLYLFICNRSARRIQRCWREFKARKIARRKARRKSKKSKK